jgi:hypothetical protein
MLPAGPPAVFGGARRKSFVRGYHSRALLSPWDDMIHNLRIFTPHSATAEDMDKARQIQAGACPRRYC